MGAPPCSQRETVIHGIKVMVRGEIRDGNKCWWGVIDCMIQNFIYWSDAILLKEEDKYVITDHNTFNFTQQIIMDNTI